MISSCSLIYYALWYVCSEIISRYCDILTYKVPLIVMGKHFHTIFSCILLWNNHYTLNVPRNQFGVPLKSSVFCFTILGCYIEQNVKSKIYLLFWFYKLSLFFFLILIKIAIFLVKILYLDNSLQILKVSIPPSFLVCFMRIILF